MKRLLALLILLTAATIHAASVSIAWDPPICVADGTVTNRVEYRIYNGFASRDYSTNTVNVGTNLCGTVANLDSTLTYYFAALPEEVLKSLRREVIQLAKDGKAVRKRIKAKLKIKS